MGAIRGTRLIHEPPSSEISGLVIDYGRYALLHFAACAVERHEGNRL